MINTKKKVVCYSYSLNGVQDADAMGYLRIVAPYTNADYEIIPGIENNEIKIHPIEFSDIVIIQRNFPNNFSKYTQVIENARYYQKPVIFDIDDLFFFLPENHPDRLNHTYTSSLLPIFQAIMEANFITVTTPRLKQALDQLNPNIEVLPNYLDDNIWKLRNPVLDKINSQNIVIGYMGTNSHQADLLYILPVLQDLMSTYPNRVKFRFWGVKPPEDFLSNPNVEWIPFYSMNYQQFVQFFQTQQVDIFISPLLNNEFNKCKSPLKFLEYSSLGIPGVYSSIEPYSNIIENRTTGLLAQSLEDWKECLVELIEKPDFRFELAQNAQVFLKNNWLLSGNTQIIENILHTVTSSSKIENQNTLEVINSINKQNLDFLDHLKKIIFVNDQKIDQLEKENQQMIDEILTYYLSKSWQFTRPLRKIRRLFLRKRND